MDNATFQDGLKLMQEGKYEEAYNVLSEVIKQNPKSCDALYLRSVIDFAHLKRNLEQTKNDLYYLAEKPNKFQFASMQMATILFDLCDDYDKVIELGEKALKKIFSESNEDAIFTNELHFVVARAYFHKGDKESLTKGLNKLSSCIDNNEEDDVDIDYYLLYIDILVGLNEFVKAKEVLKVIQSNFGSSDKLYFAKEKVSYANALNEIDENKKQALLEESLDSLVLCENYNGDKKQIALLRTEVYTALEKYNEALDILNSIMTKENMEDILIEKVKIYDYMGNFETPMQECLDFLREHHSWSIAYTVGYMISEQGKTKEEFELAHKLLQEAYDETKYDFILWTLYDINVELGNFKDNYDLLIEYAKSNKVDGKLAYYIGMSAQASGAQYDETEKYYTLAYKDKALNEAAYLDKVINFAKTPNKLYGKLKKCLKTPLEELEAWVKRTIAVRLIYGVNGFKVNLDLAKKYLDDAYSVLKDSPCMNSLMGRYFEEKGNNDESFNCFKVAYDLYLKDNNRPCNCAAGNLANSYLLGLGTQKDEEKAKQIIIDAVSRPNKTMSNNVVYLYAYFALKGEKDFDLNAAYELLKENVSFDRYDITRLRYIKQIKERLNIKEENPCELELKACLKFSNKGAKAYYNKDEKEPILPFKYNC